MGQLAKQRAFPTPADREVAASGLDALGVQAWIDVSRVPWVISVPDLKGRHVVLQFLSGFSEVFWTAGARTSSTRAQRLVITGPGWKGKLPAALTELKSPTGLVWLVGRIASNGTRKDLAEVHALQDRLALAPLSSPGKKHLPPATRPDPALDTRTPVRDQVFGLDAMAYFKLLATLLKTNPPAAAEGAAVATLARIGLVPGQDFDAAPLDSVALRALAAAPKVAQARIAGQWERARASVNGWTSLSGSLGAYGTDYLQRAYVASVALGASRAQDAVSAVAEVDAAGQPLDGSRRYRLHFPRGQLPPARASWSITLRDGQRALVANPLNRYAISSREKLRHNQDGSVDLVIQRASPGTGQEANWLPAPPGPFTLTLGIAWPQEKPPSVLDGSWKPPAVTPAN
jgi:hypothetical protein